MDLQRRLDWSARQDQSNGLALKYTFLKEKETLPFHQYRSTSRNRHERESEWNWVAGYPCELLNQSPHVLVCSYGAWKGSALWDRKLFGRALARMNKHNNLGASQRDTERGLPCSGRRGRKDVVHKHESEAQRGRPRVQFDLGVRDLSYQILCALPDV